MKQLSVKSLTNQNKATSVIQSTFTANCLESYNCKPKRKNELLPVSLKTLFYGEYNMQPTNRPTLDNQLSIDSVDYASSNVPFARAPQSTANYEKAFMAGAERLMEYLNQFALRIEKTIPLEKASEFERGQVDGIRWCHDAMLTLFGKD